MIVVKGNSKKMGNVFRVCIIVSFVKMNKLVISVSQVFGLMEIKSIQNALNVLETAYPVNLLTNVQDVGQVFSYSKTHVYHVQ